MRKILSAILLSLYAVSSLAQNEGVKRISQNQHKVYKYVFDTSKFDLELIKALDDGKMSLENLLTAAKRHKAVAGFNAGFYHDGYRSTGVPAWNLITQTITYAKASSQDGIYSDYEGKIYFGKISTKITLLAGGRKMDVKSINNPVAGGLKIFTNNYWTSTLTDSGTAEVVVEKGRVTKINDKGNNKIPLDGFVITSEGVSLKNLFKHFKVGDEVSYEIIVKNGPKKLDLAQVKWLINGSDVILQNGKIPNKVTNKSNKSDFRDKPHGRTGICQLNAHQYAVFISDHNPAQDVYSTNFRDMLIRLKEAKYSREDVLKMTTAELIQLLNQLSKKEELSVGMILSDFAKLMQNEGCVNAINLDGGGSATLVVGGTVINNPAGLQNVNVAGKNLRNIGDMFLIKAKYRP